MTGYHYTTWEAYQKIKENGLQLSSLGKQHRANWDWEILELVSDGCIWIYPVCMTGRKLIGQLFYVAVNHNSHHPICLEVDYAEWESVSKRLMRRYTSSIDDVRMKHDLDAGPFGHNQKRFDLAIAPIAPEQIRLVGEWDLLDLIGIDIEQLKAVA